MIFRQVIAPSTANDNYQRGEHCLVWLSTDGGIRQWLFSSSDNDEQERTRGFTIETNSSIRSIPFEKIKKFDLIAMSLDSERFDYVASILESNRIYSVSKDNELTALGIEGGRKNRSNDLKEFVIEFTVFEKEADVLNL